MKMIERILVGLGPESESEFAIDAGFALAGRLDAQWEVVQAIRAQPPVWSTMPQKKWAETASWMEDQARKRALKRLIARGLDDVGDQLHIRIGAPAAQLRKYAQSWSADLIVLGAHHERGMLKFGNTLRAALGCAPVPVWVQPTPWREVRKILVPVDLSEHTPAVLAMARDLGQALSCAVQTLFVYEPPYFAFDMASGTEAYVVDEVSEAERAGYEEYIRKFDWGPVEPEVRFDMGSVTPTILAAHENADLVVMGTHGRTGLARALLGSHADRTLRHCQRPVVVVPMEGRQYQSEG